MVTVISLGGSIVAPDKPDTDFITKYFTLLQRYLNTDKNRKVVLVIGGGGPARVYQKAFREIIPESESSEQDWIGIMATRLNAQLIKAVFTDYCTQPVVTDPTIIHDIKDQVLVAAGWKPGFSTDFDAVVLAENLGADTVMNLSNIEKVFTADPKVDPSAEPVDAMSWKDFRQMVGDEWVPGKNTPFDPVAAKKASEMGLKVIVAGGKDIENIEKILTGKDFFGTTIGPE
ncbi:MAG: UMP kinase [Spirochaetia bacterium]